MTGGCCWRRVVRLSGGAGLLRRRDELREMWLGQWRGREGAQSSIRSRQRCTSAGRANVHSPTHLPSACPPPEISEACFDAEKFKQAWAVILKRFESEPAQWRRVYKASWVLPVLALAGMEAVSGRPAACCRQHQRWLRGSRPAHARTPPTVHPPPPPPPPPTAQPLDPAAGAAAHRAPAEEQQPARGADHPGRCAHLGGPEAVQVRQAASMAEGAHLQKCGCRSPGGLCCLAAAASLSDLAPQVGRCLTMPTRLPYPLQIFG